MNLTFQAWSCVYNGPLSIFMVENRIADFTSLRYVYIELLLPVRSSTRVHLFSTYIWNWAIYETSEKSAKKYRLVFLSYVKIRIYKDICDREWLFLLFSYFGLVSCMDKKCHDIVYMKLWPKMDSRLWTCIILTDFGVCYHIPSHLPC